MTLSRREAIKLISVVAGSLWLAACSFSTKQTLLLPPIGSFDRPKINKTIALLGATGMVGGFILQQALVQGYDIRALVRTPAKLDALKNQITIIKGNARDLSSIQELLQGSDIVISALGPVKADGDAAKNISTIATGHIIQVMQQQNIERYILVSGAAVAMPGDDRSLIGWIIKIMAQMTLSDTVRDKEAEYKLLEESAIQWTLVRCPLIDAELYQHEAKVALDTPPSFNLRAGELAHFLIEQIDSQEYIRKGPFLGSL
jgi:putative NADH-flavin reductase